MRGGLLVSALYSGGVVVWVLALVEDIVLCSFASLHPGKYMGTGEFDSGGTLRWTSIPSMCSRNTLSRFMLTKLE